MKHLATAEDIPGWDNEANQLEITGLGDPIPPETTNNHFVSEVTSMQEISASNMYGKYLPERPIRFFNQVIESCSLAIDKADISSAFCHTPMDQTI